MIHKDVYDNIISEMENRETLDNENFKESILKDIAALLEKKEEGSSLDQNETKTA
jgi:hypothetical protein